MSILRVLFDNLDFDVNQFAFWEGKPFTGIAYDLMPDGHVWSELEYVDGREEGIGRTWYPSRQVKHDITYRHGGRHGPEREWFENGKLKSETIFEHTINVKKRVWDEQGNLIRDFQLDEEDPNYAILELYREDDP